MNDTYSQPVFRSFFKTLTNQTVTVELKNDIRIRGILKSVDQYLNIKLDDVEVLDLDKYPHLSSVKNMFIRGSVVRYVMLPRSEVDVGLLEDATRRGECCASMCWSLWELKMIAMTLCVYHWLGIGRANVER